MIMHMDESNVYIRARRTCILRRYTYVFILRESAVYLDRIAIRISIVYTRYWILIEDLRLEYAISYCEYLNVGIYTRNLHVERLLRESIGALTRL